MADDLDRAAYELEFNESFDGKTLNEERWIAAYLPHWSVWERAAARYWLDGGGLRLLIEEDQPPWCPDLDGPLRVSSLQTGLFAGPVGSVQGQHRFSPKAVVRQGPYDTRLYTPQHGLFEMRARMTDDPRCMAAFWMIGFEDAPERSGEICVCEIFGRDVTPDHARIGMGIHPFGDPYLVDDFSTETVPIDARQFHAYQAEWTPEQVAFFVDGQHIRTVPQSPAYPMQLMIDIYEFGPDFAPGSPAGIYPKVFEIDSVRGYRRRAESDEL